MKILITGTSAQHYSSAVAQRMLTYSGMLADAVRELKCEVAHVEPDAAWTHDDLAEYDKVFVGVTTPTSVSANGTYGALNLVSLLKDDPRLALFIDAPEPGKIFAGLRSVERKPKQLFKSFYSRRSGYKLVTQDSSASARVLDGALHLLHMPWPKTIWPTLPWYSDPAEVVGVRETVRTSLVGLSFDSLHARQPGADALQNERTRAWGIDIPSTKWARSISHTLGLPHDAIKNKKYATDFELEERIGSLQGVILSIHDDKRPWWSPLFIKSMHAGTPIVTEWRYSHKAGDAWSVLAARIEHMNKLDAYELSARQLRQYLDKIQTKEEVLTTLRQVIDSR